MKLSKMLTPLKASLISFPLAALMIAFAFSASAVESNYIRLRTGISTAKGLNGATWSRGSSASSDVTIDEESECYVVNKEAETATGEEFIGKSLQFGLVDGTAGWLRHRYDFSVPGDGGLILANGEIRSYLSNIHKIGGKVKVISPVEAPFLLTDFEYYRKDGGVEFTGDLSSESADVALQVLARTNNYTCVFSGSASGYTGVVRVETETNPGTGAYFGSTFKLGSGVAYGGSVMVASGCTFNMASGASVAGDVSLAAESRCIVGEGAAIAGRLTVAEGATLTRSAAFSVASLAIADGGVLSFSIDASGGVCANPITVTEALISAGPIGVNPTGAAIPPSKPVRYALMTFPKSSGIGVERFFVTPKVEYRNSGILSLEDDEGGLTQTLYVSYYPIVGMEYPTDSDSSTGDKGSAMTNALNWSDGFAVHSEAHYMVDRVGPPGGTKQSTYLRTPYLPDGEYVFPGESLLMNTYTHLIVMARDFTIKNLTLIGGGYSPVRSSIRGSDDFDVTIHGPVAISQDNVCLQSYNYKTLAIDGEISGSATLRMFSKAGSNDKSHSYFWLQGTNSAFKGKVVLSIETSSDVPRWSGERWKNLYVSDARNLGGPLDVFAYDAFTIENMCQVITKNSVEFDDQTRGWYLRWIAQLDTPEADHVLTLKQPITVNAAVYKNGAGTLAMGGSLKFLDGEGALTDDVPADAALHTLYVTGGQLKALAARSLDGLDIVFSNDVSKLAVGLTVDAAATDAELRQYGFIDLKTAENPLVASAKTGAVPVTFENLPQEDLKEAFSVPICTVRKPFAADVLALLVPAEKRVMLGNVKAKITLSASESFDMGGIEAVTIKADVTPPAGLMLLVR